MKSTYEAKKKKLAEFCHINIQNKKRQRKNKIAPHKMFQKIDKREARVHKLGATVNDVCMVPRHILETVLNWLVGQSVQVICCGDQGQPPRIAGIMPHSWLWEEADYFEEVNVYYRVKGGGLKT